MSTQAPPVTQSPGSHHDLIPRRRRLRPHHAAADHDQERAAAPAAADHDQDLAATVRWHPAGQRRRRRRRQQRRPQRRRRPDLTHGPSAARRATIPVWGSSACSWQTGARSPSGSSAPCFDEGLEAVLAVSEADRDSLGAQLADRRDLHRPGEPGESYLDIPRLIAAATLTSLRRPASRLRVRVRAPRAVAGMRGCRHRVRRAVARGDAAQRRQARRARGRRGARDLDRRWLLTRSASEAEARAVADAVGFPLLLKAAAGGGGRGMRLVRSGDELRPAFSAAAAEARQAFGDGRLFVERFVQRAQTRRSPGARRRPRQRDPPRSPRLHAPAPLPEADRGGSRSGPVRRARSEMLSAATALIGSLRYRGAATCEFLVDDERQQYGFLEVNARLQVEHGVTEMVTGVDIVREQLRIAAGEPLSVAAGRRARSRARDRGARQRREPGAWLCAFARADLALGGAGRQLCPRRHGVLCGLDDPAALRLARRQGDRAGRRSPRGDREADPRARASPGRRDRDHGAVCPRGARGIRTWSRGGYTPGGSRTSCCPGGHPLERRSPRGYRPQHEGSRAKAGRATGSGNQGGAVGRSAAPLPARRARRAAGRRAAARPGADDRVPVVRFARRVDGRGARPARRGAGGRRRRQHASSGAAAGCSSCSDGSTATSPRRTQCAPTCAARACPPSGC